MTGLGSDLRYALRAIRGQPGFSLVVALTLALGLGVNATVLGIMDALLLRPFQFRDYQRLVVFWESAAGASERSEVAPANFLDWREQLATAEVLAAWEGWGATLVGRDEPRRLQGARVTPEFFDLLGITPATGRLLDGAEGKLGNHRIVVISDGLWRAQFGADRAIVGSQVLVDGEAHTIVGIAPPRFEFPVGAEVWAPLVFTPERRSDRESRTLTVIGRLGRGRSVAEAQAEIDIVGRRLAQQFPRTNRDRVVRVRTLSTAFREDVTVPLVGILQVAAGLVLLIACANLIGLFLARAIDRQREFALRTALGASRTRVVRQLVTETAVLGLVASGVAILLAAAALDALRSSVPSDVASQVEGWNNLRLAGRWMLLIPAFAIGIGLLVGLIPAMAAARTALADVLKAGERAVAGSFSRQLARKVLVVAQLAFALVLLISAALFLGGGMRMVDQPGGFAAENLLTLEITLPDNAYGAPETRREFASELLDRLHATPGVEAAALANVLPASGWSPAVPMQIEHEPIADPVQRQRIGWRVVSSAYFETMRIPITSGRAFSALDREDGQPVAIISAATAERFWPGRDPIGRRLRVEGAMDEWLTIVGVAADVTMYNWWDGVDFLAVYVPLRQAPPGGVLHAVLRTRGAPLQVTASVREAVRAVDPGLPIQNVRTMQRAVADSSLGLNMLAMLMAVCGGIAVVLSIAGIYSVMAYTMSQRAHEFGVRIALGGTTRDVLRLTLGQAAMMAAIGVLIGSLAAFVCGRLMSSALFGIISLQPLPFVAIGGALAAVAIGAAFLPARRVLRMDPAAVMRA